MKKTWKLFTTVMLAALACFGISETKLTTLAAETEYAQEKVGEKPEDGFHLYGNPATSDAISNNKASDSGKYGDNISWVYEDGVLTISGKGDMLDTSSANPVPWNSYKADITKVVINSGITAIGAQNFYNCTALEEVEIPTGVTAIREAAFFQCYKLDNVKLPNTVKTICGGAFASCYGLKTYSGSGVEEVGEYAFQETNIDVFEISKSAKEIDTLAFFKAEIKEFKIASGNTNFMVENGVVFNNDKTSLIFFPGGKECESYTIPASCTRLCAYSFCFSKVKKVVFNNVETLEEGVFYGSSLTGELVLSDKIKEIAYFEFQDCHNITSVKFGKGLKSTKYCMFQYCTGLKTIDYGNTLEFLDMRTFLGCDGLETVTIPDRMTDWGGSVFNSCSNLKTFKSKNLIEVGYADFAQCYSLTDVKLENVEIIYRQAFANCPSLKQITLPKTTMLVNDQAFSKDVQVTCLNKELEPFGYTGLRRLDKVTISGERKYAYAYDVLKIVNDKRKEKGLNPVKMDKSLLDTAMIRAEEQAVLFSHTRPDGGICFTVNDDMLAENIAIGNNTPASVMTSWMNSAGHKANILTGEFNSIGIGCYYIEGQYTWVQVFSVLDNPEECKKPSDTKTSPTIKIAMETFSEAATTSGIIFGSPEKYTYEFNVTLDKTEIKNKEQAVATFKLTNPGFTYMSVPIIKNVAWSSSNDAIAKIDSIGNVSCVSTGSADIEGKTKYFTANNTISVKVDVVNENEFIDSKSKAKYKITNKTKKEVKYLYSTDKTARTVIIPDTVTYKKVTYKVTKIADSAFKNNKIIEKVVIGNNVTIIGSNAFNGASKLNKITVGKRVATIGSGAFRNCTALTKLTLYSNVKKIGAYSFSGCKKLKALTIKSKILVSKNLDKKAFSGIKKTTKIRVPVKKLKAYKTLFRKKGLNSKVKVVKY